MFDLILQSFEDVIKIQAFSDCLSHLRSSQVPSLCWHEFEDVAVQVGCFCDENCESTSDVLFKKPKVANIKDGMFDFSIMSNYLHNNMSKSSSKLELLQSIDLLFNSNISAEKVPFDCSIGNSLQKLNLSFESTEQNFCTQLS